MGGGMDRIYSSRIIIWYGLLYFYILSMGIRFILSKLYIKEHTSIPMSYMEWKIFENKEIIDYTIVQPILSGDRKLYDTLRANVLSSKNLRFLWLLDREDRIAKEICQKIIFESNLKENIEILYFDKTPQGYNPKAYKLAQAVKRVQSKYLIVLDDDSVIDMERMGELLRYSEKKEEYIITGIPYNYDNENIYSKLLSAFVNANAFLTYFVMAKLRRNYSINGMFYIIKMDIIKKYHVFEEVIDDLCDDLAVAKYLQGKGVQIIQSTIPVNVRTSIKSMKHYYLQLHRWFLFTKIYFKENPDMITQILITFGSAIPFILLIMAMFMDIHLLFKWLLCMIIKSVINYIHRYLFLRKFESASMIFYEIINDIVMVPIFLKALLGKPVIIWRDKKIRVIDGKIKYE